MFLDLTNILTNILISVYILYFFYERYRRSVPPPVKQSSNIPRFRKKEPNTPTTMADLTDVVNNTNIGDLLGNLVNTLKKQE
jgi:hypothetical protein